MPSDPTNPFGSDDITRLAAWLTQDLSKLAGWVLTAVAAVVIKITGIHQERSPQQVLGDGIGTLALYHILVLVFVGLDLRWELSLGFAAILAVAGWMAIYRFVMSLAQKHFGLGKGTE